MNTPVQGSAADLIKKAMVDLHRELRAVGMPRALSSRFTTSRGWRSRKKTTRPLLKDVMEDALKLDVPLLADAHLGKNWAEVH